MEAHSLTIGSWRRKEPLTCFFSRRLSTLSWTLISDSVGFRLDTPYTSIRDASFTGPCQPSMSELAEGVHAPLGVLRIHLVKPPQFFMETFRSAGPSDDHDTQRTMWRQCQDFTQGQQGTVCPVHVLTGPYLELKKAITELKQSNAALGVRITMQDEASTSVGSDFAGQMSSRADHQSAAFGRQHWQNSQASYSQQPLGASLDENRGMSADTAFSNQYSHTPQHQTQDYGPRPMSSGVVAHPGAYPALPQAARSVSQQSHPWADQHYQNLAQWPWNTQVRWNSDSQIPAGVQHSGASMDDLRSRLQYHVPTYGGQYQSNWSSSSWPSASMQQQQQQTQAMEVLQDGPAPLDGRLTSATTQSQSSSDAPHDTAPTTADQAGHQSWALAAGEHQADLSFSTAEFNTVADNMDDAAAASFDLTQGGPQKPHHAPLTEGVPSTQHLAPLPVGTAHLAESASLSSRSSLSDALSFVNPPRAASAAGSGEMGMVASSTGAADTSMASSDQMDTTAGPLSSSHA